MYKLPLLLDSKWVLLSSLFLEHQMVCEDEIFERFAQGKASAIFEYIKVLTVIYVELFKQPFRMVNLQQILILPQTFYHIFEMNSLNKHVDLLLI